MEGELTIGVEARAAVHAALADPARLRMVDALSEGDAAPSELAAMLGMPSNLVAHHLRVLEEVGLVARRRSEADRRRTYLQLVPGVLDGLTTPVVRPTHRVLFVCTANSARSHLAAALWKQASPVPADSAGTHPATRIEPAAIDAAARHGLPLRRRRPSHLDDVRRSDDLIITVCDLAHEELAGELANVGTVHWSVSDPVPAGDPDTFDDTVADLSARIERLAPRLAPTA